MNKISQTLPCQADTIFSPFKAEEFEHALRCVADAGFTGVELAVARPQDVDVGRLNHQVTACGLTITTLSTGQAYGLYGVCLSSPDEETRKTAVDYVKGHIDVAAGTGRPAVTIGLLRGKSGERRAFLERLKKSLFPCLEYAEGRGVTLQIEPINKSETTLLNSTFEVLEFLDELGSPDNLGLLYDTYHSHLEDGDIKRAIEAAAGKITNVHLADSHRGLPGYGDIDFKLVFALLRKGGYAGAYALETLSVPSADFVRENGFKSVMKFFQSDGVPD
ncbi:MAG: sugar phosphate isomerase/epimerase [Synergistaceae bacterium]|jgi:sugar phosphate isomerase/epimerase|nr:sugar phosphate isomerase/epimerase [Synergistaceae bacterium]